MEQIRSGPMAGRTVLVTGGSGGIGRATALGLAAMGAHLAITGRDRGRTQDAAREIRAAGRGQVDVFVADLSCQSQVRRLAGECGRTCCVIFSPSLACPQSRRARHLLRTCQKRSRWRCPNASHSVSSRSLTSMDGAMLETCGSAGRGRDVKEGCTFPVTEL